MDRSSLEQLLTHLEEMRNWAAPALKVGDRDLWYGFESEWIAAYLLVEASLAVSDEIQQPAAPGTTTSDPLARN